MVEKERRRSFFCIFVFFISFIGGESLFAQENPPFPVKVEVRNAQGLNFGAFTVGPSGGRIQMSTTGERTSTGNIFLLNTGLYGSPSYAIFDAYVNPGTLLQVQIPSQIELFGSASTNCLTLQIDPQLDISTDNFNGSSFITTTNPQPIFVGGTLLVDGGCGDFPGTYSGTFTLTLIHE